MRHTTILFILAVLAALVVAGCTSTSPTVGPTTPGAASTTAQTSATTSASTSKEKSWPVQSSHDTGPGSISGTITRYNGNPAANWALYLWASGKTPGKDPAFLMVRTDANGKYTISNIPNGNYLPYLPYPNGGGQSEPSRISVDGATKWDESVP